MVINELMSSRKWEGAKVCDGITQEKFLNQQNLAAGGVKAEPEKFVHQCKHGLDERKRKRPRCGKKLPPTKFGAKTPNFKSVKMIINYGG
jgi:hypothetical protein